MVHPLPKGEGRGEGKETTAPRSTYILDLTCGRCPQGYIPTHRLIGIHDFKPPAMREVSDSVLKARHRRAEARVARFQTHTQVRSERRTRHQRVTNLTGTIFPASLGSCTSSSGPTKRSMGPSPPTKFAPGLPKAVLTGRR